MTFARITHIGGKPAKCTDFSEFVDEVVADVDAAIAAQGIFGVVLTDAQIRALVTALLDRFNQARLNNKRDRDERYSEVQVMDDVNVQPWQRIPGTFKEIANRVGPGHCDPACAPTTNVGSTAGDITTDILLSLRAINDAFTKNVGGTDVIIPLSPSLFPGGDVNATGGDHQFNSCDETKKTYEYLVHEAGHALGIGYGLTGKDQKAHHPNIYISESTMSYGAKQGCFPHPLDIMAIYAIYQTVDTR